MIDDATLNEIEARAAAATEPPWRVNHRMVEAVERGRWYALTQDGGSQAEDGAGSFATVDATFIAAARTDVPALVAEVRRLRAFLTRRMTEDYASDEYAREVLADEIRQLLNPQGNPK